MTERSNDVRMPCTHSSDTDGVSVRSVPLDCAPPDGWVLNEAWSEAVCRVKHEHTEPHSLHAAPHRSAQRHISVFTRFLPPVHSPTEVYCNVHYGLRQIGCQGSGVRRRKAEGSTSKPNLAR